MFQVFRLPFLYIASVASRYFKTRSGVAHGMRVGSGRGREQSPSGPLSGGAGTGTRVDGGDVGAVERHPSGVGPCVDA
jgi:hypothetical protein